MPYISVDVQHVPNLIEASITLSFSQLTDILKIVVEQSNQHDALINELRNQLQEQRRLSVDLQQKVDALTAERADPRGMQSMSDDVTALKAAMAQLAQRLGDVDHNLRGDLDNVSKRLTKESQSTSIAFSEQSEKIHALGKQMASDLEPAKLFVEMWGPRTSEMRELAAAGRTQEERTNYVHSLPPMQHLAKNRAKQLIDEDDDANGENGYIRRREVPAHVLGVVRPELEQVHDRLGATENGLKALGDHTAQHLGQLDERTRTLDATKADHIALNEKVDKSAQQNLAQRVDGLMEDLGSIHDRLAAVNDASSSAAPNGRKKSLASIGSVAPSEAESLRKRVAALEAEVQRLEDKKADKSQLQKLYEALDTLGHSSQPTMPQAGVTPEHGTLTPLKARPPTGHRNSLPTSNSPVNAMPEGELGVGAGRLGSASPRRVSSARPVFLGRSVVSVRDSTGSMTPASLGCVTGR